jgi:RimJ/RimL family protein N-acetyltransferase
MTARIRLRPPTIDDVAMMDSWKLNVADGMGVFNDFGQEFKSHMKTAEEGRFIEEDHGTLLIERIADGVALGSVDWRPAMYGPNVESRAWAVGISLIAAGRGQGYGGEALRLLAAYLFERSPVRRIEASTDVENVPGQRAMEKAGFTREGINRKAQFRAGEMHDLVLYSLLREDFEASNETGIGVGWSP